MEANSLFRSTPNATIRESVTKTTADLPEALRKVLDDTTDRPSDPHPR